MGTNNNDALVYTPEQIAEVRQMFQFMIEGQGVGFWVIGQGTASRRLTAKALTESGFESVYEMRTGDEALQSITQSTIPRPVTFADESMSGGKNMDYLEYTRKFLQAAPRGVIFLTCTRISPARYAEALNNGVSAVFTRPLDFKEILGKLQAMNIKARR